MLRALPYIVAAGALLVLMRGSVASVRRVAIDDSTGLPDVDPNESPAGVLDDLFPPPIDLGDYPVTETEALNLRAFLYALRKSEHLASDVASGDDYRTFYGGSRFSDMSDHPVNTGEKRGVPLPPDWCRKLGFASGQCVSTAAGAYQFTKPTWNELRAMGEWLPDFSPESQDEAARRLLAKDRALPHVLAGDLETAVRIASRRWASLPGSTAGQHTRSVEFVAQAFIDGLQSSQA